MDIKVQYNLRKAGQYSEVKIDTIFVEDDSNEKELDQQIREHLQSVWNDNTSVVEISTLMNNTDQYEIIGQSPLTKK